MTRKIQEINLKLENLSIGYSHAIITDINVKLHEKALICLIGKNGSGKSTLLNTIVGLLNPLKGKVLINEIENSKYSSSDISKLISYVPSKIDSFAQLSVTELVSLGRTPYTNIFDLKSDEDHKIINDSLTKFGIDHLKEKKIHEISDGERQKAMIARAFAQQTPIIILDEPTAYLDYYNRKKLLEELWLLTEKEFKIVIFSSHDIELVVQKADYFWICDDEAKRLLSLDKEELIKTNILGQILDYTIE